MEIPYNHTEKAAAVMYSLNLLASRAVFINKAYWDTNLLEEHYTLEELAEMREQLDTLYTRLERVAALMGDEVE